jgi:flagellar hook-associated protein 2
MPTINFAGIASGIDSNALIDAISQSTRQARITPNETKVSELGETNSAFDELKDKLKNLQDLAFNFSTLGGGALSKLATSSDETAVTARASNAATNGSYTLSVVSKAKNHSMSFDERYLNTTTPIQPSMVDTDPAANRTMTFTIGQGTDQKTVPVVLTSTMTVAGFVEAFNASVLTNAPGYANASVINTGDSPNPYAIMINTNNEGTAKGLIASVGLGASVSGFLTTGDSPATNAEFSIDGVSGTIIKSSNVITDVIAGVTFSIQDDSGSATISVSDDVTKSQATIQEFVDAYNEIVQFLAENNQIKREEDGKEVQNIFSPLSKSRTDDNFLTSFRNGMSLARNQQITNDTDIAVNTLTDIGFQTQRDGTIKFVTDDLTLPNFKDAMAADSSLVNSILTRFGDIVGTVAGVPSLQPGGGIIQQYTRANGLIDVSVNGNKQLITNLNDKITQAEAFIKQQEENLRRKFASLESLTGKLQGQQQALTSALSGLGR